MFKNKINQIVLLIAVYCNCLAQYTSQSPKWATIEDISKISSVNLKKIKDGYYYVLASEQYNYITGQKFFHYATKIVSEAGLDVASQLEINFDPSYEKAAFHFVRIHRNGQVIDKTRSDAYTTLDEEKERGKGILNGRKTYYRNLDDLRKGDIVEYAYSITGINPLFRNTIDAHFYFSYSVPVGKLFYRLIVKNDNVPKIKNFFTPVVEPEINNIPGGKDMVWSIDNPPITTLEENCPSWYDPYPQIHVSSYSEWKDVKQWCKSLFVLNKESELVDELVKGITGKYPNDPISQITAIIDFCQNEIRYSGNENGIYSHHPHDPDFVLKHRYGDCKDKSLLLVTALKKINITAHPVLLNTALGDHVTDFLPSPRSFDHCITAIEYNNDYLYIDPTITLQTGTFSKRTIPDYKLCMVLDDSDKAFYEIPAEIESKIHFKETYSIHDNGDAYLESVTKYFGSHADNLRYTFASNSTGDLQEGYKEYYFKYTDEIEVVDSIHAIDDTLNNIFTVYETYNLKRFWSAKAGEKQIAQDIVPIAINERIRYVSDAIRKDPLVLYSNVNSLQDIIINRAGGWNINDEHITEDNPFFHYEFHTTIENTKLSLNYRYFNKVSYVKPDDYTAYKEKVDFLNKNIVFGTVQSVNEVDSNFNWILFITIVLFLGASLFVCFKLYRKSFSYNHIQKFTSIEGWLVLMAIGIVLSPFVLVVQVILLIKEDLFINSHQILLDSSSTNYDPDRAVYSLIANGLNVFLLVASVFLIFLFFQRKNSFRPYYVFFKSFTVVFLFIDLIMLHYYSDPNNYTDQAELNKQTTSVIRIFIQACIWVPYIWFSERSRHTFTVGNIIDAPPETEKDSLTPHEDQEIKL
jgi:hypothetical protein